MKKPSLTETQKTIWGSYQRLRLRLAERLNRELSEKTGLSEADYDILTALTETPDNTMRALSLRCGLEWEKSRLSHQLRRMEKRGLVVREDCIEDNRGTVIRVTDKGLKLAQEARLVYEQAVQQYVIDVLTPEQLASLGDIAETILVQFADKEHHTA
jgi:DNA-binding MarR family transcriptional regulator